MILPNIGANSGTIPVRITQRRATTTPGGQPIVIDSVNGNRLPQVITTGTFTPTVQSTSAADTSIGASSTGISHVVIEGIRIINGVHTLFAEEIALRGTTVVSSIHNDWTKIMGICSSRFNCDTTWPALSAIGYNIGSLGVFMPAGTSITVAPFGENISSCMFYVPDGHQLLINKVCGVATNYLSLQLNSVLYTAGTPDARIDSLYNFSSRLTGQNTFDVNFSKALKVGPRSAVFFQGRTPAGGVSQIDITAEGMLIPSQETALDSYS